ncbi:hypothetical protein A2803_05100 [Candidatus Woesebacteria bacterium RIFCSPHIGHO2_01_FULL_44_21]|uniref:TVP38/TMEM64 family membrane protein n=1 Tax=Candidatus Woesebacteria bacterium RIFCSPHIGHO2_01_FULL_44_21 TaxID=1802503 RepID=A0A1F7Z029_9BACT|nr:MAG: hypothetical protein A2803_05100 [Candidatus Woesebacteria bacterium RIFCSPHIGHO2_01_FULL_44_21]OGM68887.1 MAG: hypothetical protein A2897_01875 [Candidatus Woesebacteria bacterium RIFCSPLOWO2_01_FULL_44_24b]
MNFHSSKKKRLVKLVLLILFFLLLISTPALFLKEGFNSDNIRSFVTSFGILAPVVLIAVISSTNVIPPLAVTPFWIASIILFGSWMGFIYSFLGNLVGSSLNFYIAGIWGRPAVERLAGKSALTKIDKLPNITKPMTVFILKLVGGAATDYISYGSGLSKIKFKGYLLASGLSVLPMMIIGFSLIAKITLNSAVSTASALGIFYLINYTSTLLLVPTSMYLLSKERKLMLEEA